MQAPAGAGPAPAPTSAAPASAPAVAPAPAQGAAPAPVPTADAGAGAPAANPAPAPAPTVAGAAAAVPAGGPAPLDAGAATAEGEVKLDTEEQKRHQLLKLCEKGDFKGVEELLVKAPPSTLNYFETLKCECTDGTNFTFQRSPLLWAIHAKSHKLVSALIKAGADPNLKVDGEYALHRAVWGVNIRADPYMEIPKALIAAGADPNTRADIKGWTALHFASSEPRNYGPIQVLMAAGADPHVPDTVYGMTAMERCHSFCREYDYKKENAIQWCERLAFTCRLYRGKLSTNLLVVLADSLAIKPNTCDLIAAYVF